MSRQEIVVNPRFNPYLAALVIFLALAWLVGTTASYTIESGNIGVLSTFGDYSDDIKQPGLHFKLPGVQDVHRLDIKMQTVHYQGSQDLPDEEGVIQKPEIVVLDSKNLNIAIEITVQFLPDPQKAKEILVKYGRNYFEKLINPNIRDIVRDVAGQYQAEDVAVKRSEIGDRITRLLEDKFDDLPFILQDVQIRGIKLPKIVRNKIEEVQLAKQEEQRLSMIEKQARKNQEIKTIEANTRLIEVTVNAKAEAEKQKIAADAKAYQIEKEATAKAAANEAIAKSITKDLIKYQSVQKWKGEYPKTFLGEKVPLNLLFNTEERETSSIKS